MPGSAIDPEKKIKNTDTICGNKASTELQKALVSHHGKEVQLRRKCGKGLGEARSHLSPTWKGCNSQGKREGWGDGCKLWWWHSWRKKRIKASHCETSCLFGFWFQPPPNNLHKLFPCVNHSTVGLFLLQALSPGIIGCLPTSVSAPPYCQTRQQVEQQLRSTHWSHADFILLPQTAYAACLGPALYTTVTTTSQTPNKLHYVRPLHTTGHLPQFPCLEQWHLYGLVPAWDKACLTGPKPPCSYQHFSPGGYLYSFTWD